MKHVCSHARTPHPSPFQPCSALPLLLCHATSRLICPCLVLQHHIDKSTGGLILKIAGIIFIFVGIAIVCDEYFQPALEVSWKGTYHAQQAWKWSWGRELGA